MKKLYFLMFILAAQLFNSGSIKAQDYSPFLADNFNGITGSLINPASLADNRLRIDFTLVGFSGSFSNNFISIENNRDLLKLDAWEDPKFVDKYLSTTINGKNKGFAVNSNLLLPGILVSLSPKHSIGLSSRIRGFINLDNFDEDMAQLLYEGLDENELLNKKLNYEDLSIRQHLWHEAVLTYARVLYDNKQHFAKAGVNIKVLNPLAASYMHLKNLDFYINEADSTVDVNVDANFGVSDHFEKEFNDISDYNFKFDPSFGFDFGVIYEWRPNYADYKYDMDGKSNLWRRNKNKYKLKVGLSLLDFGRIKYNRGLNSGNFSGSTNAFDLNYDFDSFSHVTDTLQDIFKVTDQDGEFTMALPTVFTMQVDYNIYRGFYINATPWVSLRSKKSEKGSTHYATSLTLSPRFESRHFGVSLPVTLSQLDQPRFGLGVHAGPFWIGSGDIFGTLGMKEKTNAIDFHFMVKLPLGYWNKKDKDKDGISNRRDKCKNIPGVPEFEGCPDTDGDGVQDSKDACPEVPGLKKFDGCPDSDEDGIIDSEDECPMTAGIKEFKGCPDTDGDGIKDSEDNCPEVAGLKEFNGCPDTDGDKIPDHEDDCPEHAGDKMYKGCPDSDKDSIRDIDDACPEKAGPVANNGCPWEDSDNDGVLDKDDECPLTAGPAENNGCPEIEEEEQEILNTAFSNLEFETAKAVIKSHSLPSLDELAGLLKKKTDYRLRIDGHTDNVGSPESNMVLSKERAEAVKNYLISKGVQADQIFAFWHGETSPIATNDTDEGRSKNRRVEMKVIFQ